MLHSGLCLPPQLVELLLHLDFAVLVQGELQVGHLVHAVVDDLFGDLKWVRVHANYQSLPLWLRL
jgi:hypothetical protein